MIDNHLQSKIDKEFLSFVIINLFFNIDSNKIHS